VTARLLTELGEFADELLIAGGGQPPAVAAARPLRPVAGSPCGDDDGAYDLAAEIEHFKVRSEESDKIVRIGVRHPICRPPGQRHFADDGFGETYMCRSSPRD
jgi:hypothetical protein